MTKNNISIEEYLNELKTITDKMRSDISLDETVKLYKQGIQTAEKAKAMLDTYKNEIETIGKERFTDTDE